MNKMKNIKTLFVGLLLALLITPLFTLTSFATVDTSKVNPITGAITEKKPKCYTNTDRDEAIGLPPVTMDV